MELNYELHWLADATFCDVPNLARKNNPDFPFAQDPVQAGLTASRVRPLGLLHPGGRGPAAAGVEGARRHLPRQRRGRARHRVRLLHPATFALPPRFLPRAPRDDLLRA